MIQEKVLMMGFQFFQVNRYKSCCQLSVSSQMSHVTISHLQSDPTSASTLQLDELEELVDDDIIEENEILNELQIRPKTLYKVLLKFLCITFLL